MLADMPSGDLPVSERERVQPSHAFFKSIKSLSFVCYRGSEAKDEALQRLLRELPGAGVAVVDLDAYDDFRRLPIRPRETLLLAGTRETLALAAGTPMATIGYGALAHSGEESVRGAEGGEREAGRGAAESEGGAPEEEGRAQKSERGAAESEGGVPEEEGREQKSERGVAESEGRVPEEKSRESESEEREAGSRIPEAPRADLLVEGFEEVDVQLLDRMMKRAQGLPWITVVTERCILREITPGDLDALFALYAQPGITDYTEPLYEREKEEQYTRDYIANMYRFYGYGMWLVFSRESGALIGRAGFSHQDLGDEIVLEMGYIVGVPYQRQGYGTEICEKLLAFARTNLSDFKTLNCFVEPGNAASHGLMRKLGFAVSGTVEIRGKAMVRYAMYL